MIVISGGFTTEAEICFHEHLRRSGGVFFSNGHLQVTDQHCPCLSVRSKSTALQWNYFSGDIISIFWRAKLPRTVNLFACQRFSFICMVASCFAQHFATVGSKSCVFLVILYLNLSWAKFWILIVTAVSEVKRTTWKIAQNEPKTLTRNKLNRVSASHTRNINLKQTNFKILSRNPSKYEPVKIYVPVPLSAHLHNNWYLWRTWMTSCRKRGWGFHQYFPSVPGARMLSVPGEPGYSASLSGFSNFPHFALKMFYFLTNKIKAFSQVVGK